MSDKAAILRALRASRDLNDSLRADFWRRKDRVAHAFNRGRVDSLNYAIWLLIGKTNRRNRINYRLIFRTPYVRVRRFEFRPDLNGRKFKGYEVQLKEATCPRSSGEWHTVENYDYLSNARRVAVALNKAFTL